MWFITENAESEVAKAPCTKLSLRLLICEHPDNLIDNSVIPKAFLIPYKKT